MVNNEQLEKIIALIDSPDLTDKTNNTNGDWIRDYGGTVNDDMTIRIGSMEAFHKMLQRRDKEVVRKTLTLLGLYPTKDEQVTQ